MRNGDGIDHSGLRTSRPVHLHWMLLFALVLIPRTAVCAASSVSMDPVEREVRRLFPSVALDSRSTFEPAQETIAGQTAAGLRATGALRVLYPSSYDGTFVAETGEQRVALRAVGAHFSPVRASNGKLFYARPHDSVDVIDVPGAGRSEELLIVYDDRAPRVFEYEIVEMHGVADLVLSDGAIRFVPDHLADTLSIAGSAFSHPQASLQIDRPWVIDANGNRSETAAHWTIVDGADHRRRIRLTIDSQAVVYPIVIDPSFSTTGSMGASRGMHTSTSLPNGKVLIAGGFNGTVYLSSAEVYDPIAGTYTATGSMTAQRSFHSATLLPNGKVLIAGGFNGVQLSTAELYDPLTGTFTATGTMGVARNYATATMLPNGKVLVAGGTDGTTYQNTAELYDPAAGTFAATGNMVVARSQHTATLLTNGKVLFAGGFTGSFTASTELYDPATGTSLSTGSMAAGRYGHTATVLPNARVLIAGGIGSGSLYLATAELYNGPTGTFSAAGSMLAARGFHTATLSTNGRVLVTGGYNGSAYVATGELYDPTANIFNSAGSMAASRGFHSATLLPSGLVLISGGLTNGNVYLTSTEIYNGSAPAFSSTPLMSTVRQSPTATVLANTKVLVAGGTGPAGTLNSAELYDPIGGSYTTVAAAMVSTRAAHSATLLQNGQVLLAGGEASNGADLSSAELYNPASGATGAFQITGAMAGARSSHSATLLPNGQVLVAGGYLNSTAVGTAELYDPSSGSFTSTGNLNTPRASHTATLLPNGKVLIAGGSGTDTLSISSTEVYDPASGTFTNGPSMSTPRENDTATLLPSGKVLIAGGVDAYFDVSSSFDAFTYLNSTELYNPATNTISSGGTMTVIRADHGATALPNGKVLLAGGFDGSSIVSSAELYDPVAGTFTATASMATARCCHAQTLVQNDKVLLVGGSLAGGALLNTSQLYDSGLGFSDLRRPAVTSVTSPVCQPGILAFGGTNFTSDSEGSSGSSTSSPTNSPAVRLERVDNERFSFVIPQSFSASTFVSNTLSGMHAGRYRAVIVSNAIPSIEQLIDIETTPVLGTYASASVPLTGSAAVPPSSLPSGYRGTLFPVIATASAGFTGSLSVDGFTGNVNVTNAGPTGDYTLTVSATNSCAAPTTTFSLAVIGPPDTMVATAGTPQSTIVNTPFATQLQVTVRDSASHLLNNITVTFTAPGSGASATFPGGNTAHTNASGVASITANANGTAGSYNVTAIYGGLTTAFALTNIPAAPANVSATATTASSVSVAWTNGAGVTSYEIARSSSGTSYSTIGTSASTPYVDNTAFEQTAYLYTVRAVAPGVSTYSAPDLATTIIFTDPTLTPLSTFVKAAHFNELRTAANAVRTLAGLGGVTFSDALTATTPIKAIHLTELRAALDQARATLLLLPIVYSKPTITAGTSVVTAAAINELRNGVR
jgi:hypothetical protein